MKGPSELKPVLFRVGAAALAIGVIAQIAFIVAGVGPLKSVVLALATGLLGGAAAAGIGRLFNGGPAGGHITLEMAERLATDIRKAAAGDLSEDWKDLPAKVGGKDAVIPFRQFHRKLAGLLTEANRMGLSLSQLGQAILDQADMLSEGADDQSAAVIESTQEMESINSALRDVVSNVEDLSALGDEVSSSTYQMIANIKQFNQNAQELRSSVQDSVSAIEEMTGNIHGVAESADSLSSAAEQSRVSMEEIRRATQSIKDRADDASRLAVKAKEGAELGKDILTKTVSGVRELSSVIDETRSVMARLGEQSRSIGEILHVITSMASDTHLLSLNASIMAAKAGEHGRGFAVVAQEIKTLAQRTADSAKEIEDLIFGTQESVDEAIRSIEDGVKKAKSNMRLSEEADLALADVLEKVDVAAKNALEIARATEDQASTSRQVFQAVDEVANGSERIRIATREQEESSRFVRERAVANQDLVTHMAQSMSEQADASRRISQAMEQLTGGIESIKFATDEQAKSSAGVLTAIESIRRKADLVAAGAQNVNNTAMSVLNHALLLRHELKGMKLPVLEDLHALGLLFDNMREERWRRERQTFEKRAKELGVNLEIRVADGNHAAQEKQGRELIAKGVDLLIVIPVDGEAAATIAREAKKAKVPVVAYDRLVKNAELDLYVSFNGPQMGRMQALFAVQKAKGSRVLILAGSPTDSNSHNLYKGQMEILAPLVKAGGIKVVDEQWITDWSPEQAYMTTLGVLQSKGPVDAVIAANDGIAGGAIRAINELMPGRPVVVTGMDAELEACRRIVKGSQGMTIFMSVRLQASRAIEAAMLMLREEEIPGVNDSVDNGAGSVPSILLRPIKVDADNMEEVIVNEGFHSREDIYRS